MYAKIHGDEPYPFTVRVFVNGDEHWPNPEEVADLVKAPDPQTWVEHYVYEWIKAFPFAAVEVYAEDQRTGAEYSHGRG